MSAALQRERSDRPKAREGCVRVLWLSSRFIEDSIIDGEWCRNKGLPYIFIMKVGVFS